MEEVNKNEIQEVLEKQAVSRNGGMCESYEYCKFCEQPKEMHRRSSTPCADAYITLKEITDKLNNYKENKNRIEIDQGRINQWTLILNSTEDYRLYETFDSSEPYELGMPRTINYRLSPIDKILNRKEVTREMVQKWIDREKEKLVHIKREVYMLEKAFNKLKETDMFIIECKFFYNMRWTDIQISYKNKFNIDLDESNLRKRMNKIKYKILNLIKNLK